MKENSSIFQLLNRMKPTDMDYGNKDLCIPRVKPKTPGYLLYMHFTVCRVHKLSLADYGIGQDS